MKVHITTVCSVTDYRKEQTVFIDWSSVHKTRDEASEAIMTAILKENPHLLCESPVDLKQAFPGIDNFTAGRLCRLKEYMTTGDIEDGWEEDDVYKYENGPEFEAFEKQEREAIKKLAAEMKLFVEKSDKIPFQSLEMPNLPNGEYVWEPIVWNIKETDL